MKTSGYGGYDPTISSSGSLPRGISFHNNGNGTATLAGTPAGGTGGSYPIAITASNGRSPALHGDLAVNVATPGYVAVTAAGGAYAYGGAKYSGSESGHKLNAAVVGVAETPDGKGYWMVASDGGVFAFGDAKFYGSMGGRHLNKPIVGMQATPDGNGYWLVASDGGVFAFDAPYVGRSTDNADIVGVTSNSATGYLLVGSDGSVYAEGKVPDFGSVNGRTLNAPIVAIASPEGTG